MREGKVRGAGLVMEEERQVREREQEESGEAQGAGGTRGNEATGLSDPSLSYLVSIHPYQRLATSKRLNGPNVIFPQTKWE